MISESPSHFHVNMHTCIDLHLGLISDFPALKSMTLSIYQPDLDSIKTMESFSSKLQTVLSRFTAVNLPCTVEFALSFQEEQLAKMKDIMNTVFTEDLQSVLTQLPKLVAFNFWVGCSTRSDVTQEQLQAAIKKWMPKENVPGTTSLLHGHFFHFDRRMIFRSHCSAHILSAELKEAQFPPPTGLQSQTQGPEYCRSYNSTCAPPTFLVSRLCCLCKAFTLLPKLSSFVSINSHLS